MPRHEIGTCIARSKICAPPLSRTRAGEPQNGTRAKRVTVPVPRAFVPVPSGELRRLSVFYHSILALKAFSAHSTPPRTRAGRSEKSKVKSNTLPYPCREEPCKGKMIKTKPHRNTKRYGSRTRALDAVPLPVPVPPSPKSEHLSSLLLHLSYKRGEQEHN